MEKIVRVGIIGTGRHGSRYANHIVNDFPGQFKLTAISRRSEQGRQQAVTWNTTWFKEWKELVRQGDIDAVICVVTPNLNQQVAEVCAEHDIPLLLEKPLATDYAAAAAIVDCFKTKNLKLSIGQTLRYNSVILGLKNHLAQMGKLFHLSASQRLEPSTLSWLDDPQVAGAGAIFHTGVHMFDALRFITGLEIVRVRASARSVYNPQLEDLAVIEVEFSNGALGLLDTSKVSPSRAGRYEFVCEHGQLHGDQIHGELQLIEKSTVTKLQVRPPGATIVTLLEEWYRFLVGEGPNPIPGEEGLAAVKICHACRLSVERCGWVELSEIG
jgi:predicted dehydrogenase